VTRAPRFPAVAALLLGFATAVAQAPPPADKGKEKKADPAPSDSEKALEAFRQGKVDDALKVLHAAARADPAAAPPKVTLSRWLLEANQGPQARAMLEQAAAEDPGHPDVYLTNALYAMREGRLTDAVLNCEAILKLADSPRWDADRRKRFKREGRLGLAAAFEARGDWAGVKAQAAAELADDPKHSQSRTTLARALFQLNDPDAALAELKAAAADDPLRDPPDLSLAQLWSAKGDAGKADEWFNRAAKAHEKSAKVRHVYAGWLLDRGRVGDAAPQVAAAKALAPDAPDTKAATGMLARYQKDYPAARAVFEEMVRDRPANGFAVANLALVLAESADEADRKRGLETAASYARQNPNSPDARAVHGYCLLKNGRVADAEKELTLALSAPVASADTGYYAARLLFEKGQFGQARDLLKKALDAKGPFVYRADAAALLAEAEAKVPKKDEPKK
jgi:Tfp pilus assembly protein PilF